MSAFSKGAWYTTLAGMGMVAASGAQAVNVSADGRGQALLYPYYTTRADSGGNTYGTLLSVVNATPSGKAVRVRFLEGKNSREVLDFNLFLSPFDVWTGAILPDPATGGARIGSTDLSCTLPALALSPPEGTFLSFSNTGYAGVNDDGAGSGFDRTKEGYFEIIEMASYSASSTTGIAITHVNGIPPCHQFVPAAGSQVSDAQAALDAQPPSGGLFGAMTLINVASGTDYTADAVALANFYQGGSNYHASTEALPDLTQATPPVSAIQAPNGMLYESTWAAGSADPVSAVLMHDSLANEYVLDSATRSGTDWVVTFPTKRFYVRNGTGNASLFQRNFNGASGSCDDLDRRIWDREERTSLLCPDTGVCSGPFPPNVTKTICWAGNVITFNNSNVLGSTNVADVESPFQNGWLNIAFPTAIAGAAVDVHKLINVGATSISGVGHATTSGNTTTYVGLPAIGFAVASFSNGTLTVGTPPINVLSNYGGNFVHKTSSTIQ